MGATVTAALVHGPVIYIAQVGDSRAYLIRGSQIKQLTKDQSLAQMLIDSGAILPEQAASVPQNVIMQALGTQPTVKVAMTTVQLCRNDCLLLCSDGLSNKIQPGEMKQSVEQKDDLSAACRWLIDTANERGGEDNITVVIARFDGEALGSASEVKSITGSFGTLGQDYMSESASLRAAAMPDPGVTTMLTAPDEFEPEPVDSETSIRDEVTPLHTSRVHACSRRTAGEKELRRRMDCRAAFFDTDCGDIVLFLHSVHEDNHAA